MIQMRWVILLSFCLIAVLPGKVSAQQTDSLLRQLDSLSKAPDSIRKPENNIAPEAYNERTKITPRVYFILLGTDLVQEVTGPFHSSKKTWVKVGIFAAAGGALLFADEPIQRFAVKLSDKNPGVHDVGRYVTNFGGLYESYTLAAFGLYGYIFKNEKMKTTTLLASQAYLTGAAMETALKYLSGRLRPNHYDPNHPEPEPTFLGPFQSLGQDQGGSRSNSSFPSGHTTVAFAAATVFAMEYKDKPYIPVIAYGAATLIGLSRITENKHWATDVFAGAALGYVTGRQVVNNYHRYARLQAAKKRKGSFSFQLQYSMDGALMPGFVYKFR